MPTTEEQYRSALRHIINVLEPLGWACPDHPCEGCNYEMEEALVTAMNVLSGLDLCAHLGPAVAGKRVEGKLVFEYPEGYEEELQARKERREAAWTAAGFRHEPSKQDPTKMVWRRPDKWPDDQ